MYQRFKENQMSSEEGPELERDPVGLTDDEVAQACKEPEDATQVCVYMAVKYYGCLVDSRENN